MEASPLSAPSPASARRQPILTLRMQEIAQELQQHKAATPRAAAGQRAAAPEALLRCVGFCRFFWTCAAGACASLAPPTLAVAEAICVALVYLLAVPNAVPTRTGRLHYTFPGSAEDVVALSLLRCVAVAAAQVLGSGARFQRPYLLCAAGFAAVSLPLGLMKLVALRHSQWAHRQWPPFIALYCAHMAFAVAHVLAAQRFVDWARSRWEHGLGGWGFPWQEGEDAWMLMGHLQSQAEEGRGSAASGSVPDGDVPPEQLADPDSRWVESGGLRVHYKLALPLGHRSSSSSSIGVVLVHSFGGGAFSWRHIQQPLADACGLPVLAFDRPGFGLTERPAADLEQRTDSSPYSLKAQALLTLELSATLGLRQVVLVGHGDGALLALMSAAIACRELALPPLSPLVPTSSPLALADTAGGGATGGGGVAAGCAAARAAGAEMSSAVPMRRWPAAHHTRRGSLPDSLDLAWFSSGPESHSVLQRLLRGDWPASIDPHAGSEGGGSLVNGWAAGRPAGRRSPLRQQYSAGRRSMGAADPLLLEPFLEEEAGGEEEPASGSSMASHQQQQQQQQGGADEPADSSSSALLASPPAGGTSSTEPSAALLAARQSVYTNASFVEGSDRSSATQEGGLLAAAGGLMDNPSYLSGTSSARSSLEQQGGSGTATEPATEQSSFVNPSFVSGGSDGRGSSSEGEGRGLPTQESSLLRSQVLDNPSFVSETSDAEAQSTAQPLPPLAEQREWEAASASTAEASVEAAAGVRASQQQDAQPPAVQQMGGRSEEIEGAAKGLAAQASGSVGSEADGWAMPEPAGLVLLHPDLSGNAAPKFARVLAQSRLGRRMLRRLLRHEVGEVSNRRAWANASRLTPDLLALYRCPQRVEGWDVGLVGVARARGGIHSLERAQLLATVADAGLPLLVATGEHDHMVPPAAVSRVAQRLGAVAPRLAVLSSCGHFSHEERPAVLLDFLAAFVSDVQHAQAMG